MAARLQINDLRTAAVMAATVSRKNTRMTFFMFARSGGL